MAAMNDVDPDDKSFSPIRRPWWRSFSRRWWLVVCCLFPVQYVLLIGPIVWCERRGYFLEPGTVLYSIAEYYYAPVTFVLEKKLPGKKLLESYMSWWM